jgi:hypothetical protein
MWPAVDDAVRSGAKSGRVSISRRHARQCLITIPRGIGGNVVGLAMRMWRLLDDVGQRSPL